MKILIFSFYHPPDLSAGSFRIGSLLKELSKYSSSIEIDVITTRPNRYKSHDKSIIHEDYEFKFNIHRVDVPSHKSGILDQTKSFIYFLIKAIKISRNINPDIIFATSSRLMTAALAAYVSRIKKVDLILDIRDIFTDSVKEIFNPFVSYFIYPIIKLIEKFTFQTASKINIVSNGFREHIMKIAPNSEIFVYPNGVDDLFLQHKNLIHNNKSFKNILYVGNIGEGQGLHKIIPQVAQELGDKIHFTIIGDGGRANLLKNIINKENINNIKLIDAMPRSSLLNYYDQADILFLHLNDYDCYKKVLPSKIFEYASLEKPIIAGVGGYAKNFLNDEVPWAQTFKPCSAIECIKAIKNINNSKIDSRSFKQKYKRSSIMEKFVINLFNIKPQ